MSAKSVKRVSSPDHLTYHQLYWDRNADPSPCTQQLYHWATPLRVSWSCLTHLQAVFFPGDAGTLSTGNIDFWQEISMIYNTFRYYALNITIQNQMYHLQLVIRDIYTFKRSINVKVMTKHIYFSQEIWIFNIHQMLQVLLTRTVHLHQQDLSCPHPQP